MSAVDDVIAVELTQARAVLHAAHERITQLEELQTLARKLTTLEQLAGDLVGGGEGGAASAAPSPVPKAASKSRPHTPARDGNGAAPTTTVTKPPRATTQTAIVDYLERHGPSTPATVIAAIPTSPDAVNQAAAKLVKKGLLERTGPRSARIWKLADQAAPKTTETAPAPASSPPLAAPPATAPAPAIAPPPVSPRVRRELRREQPAPTNGDQQPTLQGRILDAIAYLGKAKPMDIANRFQIKPETAARVINELVDAGDLRRRDDGHYETLTGGGHP